MVYNLACHVLLHITSNASTISIVLLCLIDCDAWRGGDFTWGCSVDYAVAL